MNDKEREILEQIVDRLVREKFKAIWNSGWNMALEAAKSAVPQEYENISSAWDVAYGGGWNKHREETLSNIDKLKIV